MKVLLIRHAIAESREVFQKTGKSDDLRPLTARGRKRMRQNSRGIIEIVSSLDLLVTSPLLRAQQTAEIIKEKFKKVNIETIGELKPESPLEMTLAFIKKQKGGDTVAFIGHEPQLGELATFLLTGQKTSFLAFKKGGICLLEFLEKVDKGRANLICFTPPSQLRKIAKAG